MNVLSCATWDCINSFANWLSAIGTILISGLALWLSVRDRLVNLAADISVGLVPGNDSSSLDRQVFVLSFTNAGVRPVTVTNHVWRLPLRRKVMIMFPHLDPTVGRLCTQLPVELTDGKSGHAFYPIDFFKKVDNPEQMFRPKSRTSAWLRIRFFSMHISTSVGKKVQVKVSSSVRRELWRQLNDA